MTYPSLHRPTLPFFALLALLLLSAAPVPAAAEEPAETPEPAAQDPSRWARLAHERLPRLEVCRPEGAEEDMLCGTLSVWEDRAAAAGRKIDLNVVVVPARAKNPSGGPIALLGGGPGEGVAAGAPQIAGELGALLTNHDVLLVDQRGTGESHPLVCDFGVSPQTPQAAFDGMFPVEKIERCREQLEGRADLTKYTTALAVEDLEEVRRWLGYDELNLIGGSYGTRYAQEFMRRHPESVRTVVLQGVTSMDQRMPLHHAVDGQRAMDLLFALCEANAECSAAFPGLRTEFWDVLERLEEEPAEATVENPMIGEEVTLTAGRGIFAESLRSMLYDAKASAALPFIVHRAHQGDFAPFFRTTLPWRVFIETGVANALYLSITCAEDVPFFSEEDAERMNAGTFLGDYRTDAQKAACAVWPRAEIPEGFREPVETDVPVLILDGELDPVTPPRYGRAAAEHMPNGLFVLIPRGHHGHGGMTHMECMFGLVGKLLATASVEGLDPSCVRTMERPPWVTEESQMGYAEEGDEGKEENGEG